MERDYYEVLQLHPSADPGMILQAYRHLARKYRASMAGNPFAERAMEELDRSFDVLGSPESRAAYDRERTARGTASRAARGPDTKRVSIAVSFWDLPAWQGMLAAACVVALAVIALAAGAQPLLVLALTLVATAAALLVLPRRLLREQRFHLRRQWRRELTASDLRASTSRIIGQWRHEHGESDAGVSLVDLMSGDKTGSRSRPRSH